MAGSRLVASVVRALDLLRLAAGAPNGLRLAELAAASELKKTTAYNLLRSLVARGFLVQDDLGRYQPGPAINELARLRHDHDIMVRMVPYLRRASELFPTATVTFSELTPNATVCRLRLSPDRPGEVQRPVDQTFAPYRSASAICLQATALNSVAFERNLPFHEHGSGRWKSHAAFVETKAEIQRCGYYAVEESQRISIAFAMPDNFVLGLSLERPPSDFLATAQTWVEQMRRELEAGQ